MEPIRRVVLAGLLLLSFLAAAQADATVLNYNIICTGAVVGKQAVKVEKVKVDGRPMTRIAVSGSVGINLLVYSHAFQENLEAYFDGEEIHKYTYTSVTNGKRLAIRAQARGDKLHFDIDRNGAKERTLISRSDYGFNSWSTYVTPDRSYVPTRKGASRSVKMLLLETAELQKREVTNEGVVTISCLGRNHRALRLKWDKGKYCNYSWQLLGHDFVPARFVVDCKRGSVTYELTRLQAPPRAAAGYARR